MATYRITEEMEGFTVSIYFDDEWQYRSILEARHRGDPLVGPYSVRKDSPHSSKGQPHLHIFNRNNELFAINRDGSAHDCSQGYRIPVRVAIALRKKYPNFEIPQNNIIESAPRAEEVLTLLDIDESTTIQTAKPALSKAVKAKQKVRAVRRRKE